MTASRVRIRFAKHGRVRFTSHRDVARIWERALRRAGVPVAYSAGFSPRPKISFGLALSTGYSSDAEYLDVEINLDPAAAIETDGLDRGLERGGAAALDAEALGAALSSALPEGMDVLAAAPLARGEPSLQQSVTSCTWRIDASGADASAASASLARALAGDELLCRRERKGRISVEDIGPSVLAAEVRHHTADGVRLIAELGTQPRATRPAELLASLDPPLEPLRVCRLHQWITADSGQRREPLAVAEPSATRAEVAS